MRFNDFAGNVRIKNTLQTAIDTGHVPNAMLIEGESGTGKSYLAEIIAGALLCSGEGERPCGICRDCETLRSGGHPDLVKVEGTGKTGIISVDRVREISDTVSILPNQSDYRVYIIEDAQNMTVQAQNALLKMLEEPPAFVVFVLTCVSRFGLLPTIISRTQVFTLSPVSSDEAVCVLHERFPDADMTEIENAAISQNGNIGAASALLRDSRLAELSGVISDMADCITHGNEYDLLMTLARFEKEKAEFQAMLAAFRLAVRDAVVMKAGGSSAVSCCPRAAETMCGSLTQKNLSEIIELIGSTERLIERNVYFPLVLTGFCSGLWECTR